MQWFLLLLSYKQPKIEGYTIKKNADNILASV